MTSDEILALPLCPTFTYEDRILNGCTVRVSVAPPIIESYWLNDGLVATDTDGVQWKVVKMADSSFARIRCVL